MDVLWRAGTTTLAVSHRAAQECGQIDDNFKVTHHPIQKESGVRIYFVRIASPLIVPPSTEDQGYPSQANTRVLTITCWQSPHSDIGALGSPPIAPGIVARSSSTHDRQCRQCVVLCQVIFSLSSFYPSFPLFASDIPRKRPLYVPRGMCEELLRRPPLC